MKQYNFVEKLYARAHSAFAQVGKSVVESQVVGYFLDGFAVLSDV